MNVWRQAGEWLKIINRDESVDFYWEIGPIEITYLFEEWPGGPWWIRFPDDWMSIKQHSHDSGWRHVDRRTITALLCAAQIWKKQEENGIKCQQEIKASFYLDEE